MSSHEDICIYMPALYDRYSMYADIIRVALTLTEYLKAYEFKAEEIRGFEQETTAALCSVIKVCSAALVNLEADTRNSEAIVWKMTQGTEFKE